MTDLEDLWDDYPTGEPPVADLLRRGRAESRARRRYLVRPLLAGATVAAVASAFVIGTHTHSTEGDAASTASNGGARNGTAAGTGHAELRNAAFQADLQPADSCAQLLDSYQQRALKQVTAYGWSYGGWGMLADGVRAAAGGALVHATAPVPAAAGKALDGVASSGSGTNVQEAGVDEPDRVKTNGSLLVRAGQDSIRVYDVTGAEVRLDAELELPDISQPELLMSGTRLVAVGYDTARTGTPGAQGGGTRVEAISLADPEHPTITAQVRYSGSLDTARLTGSDVHLVLADGLPNLKFAYPHDKARGDLTKPEALARNQELIRATTLDDWLPRYDDGSGSRPLLGCDRVAMPPDGVALGTESVVGFDIATPTKPDAIGIAGTTSVSYESADRLYLVAQPGGGMCMDCVHPLATHSVPLPPRGGSISAKSTIFQLDLHGTGATHVATGAVDGSIADRWSMDEAGGVLRVAITHQLDDKQASAVVTLRPDGTKLVEVGRLDGLGVGETLTAARWFDDLAILSTAKQTDPLFTVDLSDPTHPSQLGALHIPGFSSYFHPIGDGRLLGIGQAVAFEHSAEHEQAQVGLFDISDLSDVKQLAVDSLDEWTWPNAGGDPHAFTWLPDRHVALTSFRTQNGSTLLGEYAVDGSTLSQKLIPLEGRRYAMTVRTMELPSGKVVLMAGGRVSFLDL